MASKEINDFTEKTTLVTTDEFLMQETSGGTTKKSLLSTIFKAINALTAKTTPVGADEVVISDSADSNAAKKVTITNLAGTLGVVPTAGILPYAMTGSAPSGYLLCDGTAVSRTTYADLFAVIGELYGAGDTTTTFNLPDFQGQFLRGFESGVSAAIGTKQDDAMQRITGTINTANENNSNNTGAFSTSGSTSATGTGSGTAGIIVDFDSADSTSPNTAKTDDDETRPTNFAVQWIIKT